MRTSNIRCQKYVEKQEPFLANNLSGRKISNDCYVVLSYGWWPIWAYINGQWYGHHDKYSCTTTKHRSQSYPNVCGIVFLENKETLQKKIDEYEVWDNIPCQKETVKKMCKELNRPENKEKIKCIG